MFKLVRDARSSFEDRGVGAQHLDIPVTHFSHGKHLGISSFLSGSAAVAAGLSNSAVARATTKICAQVQHLEL